MTRRPWLVVLAILAFSAGAFAQVSITSPASNQTVRGVVKVQGVKPDPDSGWIAYKLEGPSQKNEFIAAIGKPYVFVWDTLARSGGKALYPDGTYTITAAACTPAGQPLGTTSVTVTVNNSLSGSDAPYSVRLRLNYKRGSEYTYEMTGKRTVDMKKEITALLPMVKDLNGTMKAVYRNHAMTSSNGGPAIVRLNPTEAWTRFGEDKPTNIKGAGDLFTLVFNPLGQIKAKRDKDPEWELGQLTMELPEKDLQVGATWQGKLWLMLDPAATSREEVKAQSKLDGFQWYKGHKVARIVSTFKENGTKMTIRLKNATAQVKTDFSGTRTSYFAFEEGRFVGIEDEISHKYEIDSSVGPDGMPMPGMPMEPGMAAPGMAMPGMGAAPGAFPGAPGMPGMPGAPGMPMEPGMAAPGMPGMPGMPGREGQDGMQQMVPQKIKATGSVAISMAER